ncbi:TPA: hypothetical protein ACH3X2_011428 [Trebouxia sp. C0005]
MDALSNIGILAVEPYFPSQFVDQAELEKHDNVPAGKYTVGLGQTSMAFFKDQENVVSAAMTVTQNLMDKYQIDPRSIGRLEVGTESSIDRSKSIKTFLMALFADSGNTDIEGVDNVNACYGGTAGLYNAINWIESRAWDGRYAMVVASDEAVYAEGPARPSGGAGAVAFLVGPNAPLVLERGLTSCHMEHMYDFYKPAGVYPKVDGPLSLKCYMRALETCYIRLCRKAEVRTAVNIANPRHPHAPHAPTHSPLVQPTALVVNSQPKCDPNSSTPDLIFPLSPDPSQAQISHTDSEPAAASAAAAGPASLTGSAPAAAPNAAQNLELSDFDYCCFHSPFHKLVRKAFARLCHIDKLRQQRPPGPQAAGSSASSNASETTGTAQAETRQERHPQGAQAHQDALQAAHPQHTQSPSQLQHPCEQHSPSMSHLGMHSSPDQLHEKQRHQQQAPGLQQQPPPGEQAQRLHQLLEAEAAELHKQLADTLSNRALEKAMADESAAQFEAKVKPGCLAGQALGNMYSASLGMALASLIEAKGAGLEGSKILVFSYGSGLAAGMFVLKGRAVPGAFALHHLQSKVDLQDRLQQRTKSSPEEFAETMHVLEQRFHAAEYHPVSSAATLHPHTYYLKHIDHAYRSSYSRVD